MSCCQHPQKSDWQGLLLLSMEVYDIVLAWADCGRQPRHATSDGLDHIAILYYGSILTAWGRCHAVLMRLNCRLCVR